MAATTHDVVELASPSLRARASIDLIIFLNLEYGDGRPLRRNSQLMTDGSQPGTPGLKAAPSYPAATELPRTAVKAKENVQCVEILRAFATNAVYASPARNFSHNRRGTIRVSASAWLLTFFSVATCSRLSRIAQSTVLCQKAASFGRESQCLRIAGPYKRSSALATCSARMTFPFSFG